MNTRFSISTERISVDPLGMQDDAFMLELLNTEGWIRFIGDRNVHTLAEAVAYVERILGREDLQYWTVRIKTSGQAIGIISFIKRPYLDHHDIGFAFLPAFSKQGYAFEAASAVLQALLAKNELPKILATTLPANESSIRLLQKMGFVFEAATTTTDDIQIFIFGFPNGANSNDARSKESPSQKA